jgi:IS5 family transposase
MARKSEGKEAKLSYAGHLIIENRHGLVAGTLVNQPSGHAECAAASALAADLPGSGRITIGADKGYDTRDFVAGCRERNVTPHVAQNRSAKRRSAIDGRTTSERGYAISQRVRKRVEEIFGWMKTVGGFRKTRYRGVRRTQFAGYLVGCAYNLMRMSRLLAATS